MEEYRTSKEERNAILDEVARLTKKKELLEAKKKIFEKQIKMHRYFLWALMGILLALAGWHDKKPLVIIGLLLAAWGLLYGILTEKHNMDVERLISPISKHISAIEKEIKTLFERM